MKIDTELHQRRGGIFICITALARILGLITLAGLGFVTYLEWLGIGSVEFRIYITVVTTIVAYLELLWILDKFIVCCICCFRSEICFYWLCCIPIDNWIKTSIYIGLAIPFFVPTWLIPAIRTDVNIVGLLLITTGLLYFMKTFKYKKLDHDDINEDTAITSTSPSVSRPSICTQTSTIGMHNDPLSSEVPPDQDTHPKP